MVSFKLKLVASFVFLTLLPLGAAFWGYESLVHRSETRRADARLQAELRAAENAYREEVLALGRAATRLASDPAFQRALRDGNRTALDAYVAANPHLSVRVGKGIGSPAARRSTDAWNRRRAASGMSSSGSGVRPSTWAIRSSASQRSRCFCQ